MDNGRLGRPGVGEVKEWGWGWRGWESVRACRNDPRMTSWRPGQVSAGVSIPGHDELCSPDDEIAP